jgi:hypothetical protein
MINEPIYDGLNNEEEHKNLPNFYVYVSSQEVHSRLLGGCDVEPKSRLQQAPHGTV